ncbi:MAG: hypothetical protein ACRCZM_05220, partial [Bacteroidales bacterium]
PEGYALYWISKPVKSPMDEVVKYVVYAFEQGKPINISDASAIVAVTNEKSIILPYDKGNKKYTYVVTTMNRYNKESPKGKKRKVKL